MDKITRLLLLYSKLIQGEKVNKTVFCMEADCLPRSFDRDIEDIRLFLSESFSTDYLIYDRLQNAYYISRAQRTDLEVMEYLFIERILLDTAILRQDELDVLVSHLLSNTEKSDRLIKHSKESVKQYEEPLHKKALLKMHGDLETTIRNKSVIKINYTKMDGDEVERTVIPCAVKYDLGYIYLIAFREKQEDSYPAYFRLDRIYSFTILRSQLRDEQKKVSEYINKYYQGITQMYGGDFSEIIVCCQPLFYSYVHDKFKNAEIVSETPKMINIRLWAFDDGFLKWIMSQPPEMIKVIEPSKIVKKIAKEADKIARLYTEVLSNGKKD